MKSLSSALDIWLTPTTANKETGILSQMLPHLSLIKFVKYISALYWPEQQPIPFTFYSTGVHWQLFYLLMKVGIRGWGKMKQTVELCNL